VSKLQLRILHLRFTSSAHLFCNLRQEVLTEMGFHKAKSGNDCYFGEDHSIRTSDVNADHDDSPSEDPLAECLDCSTMLSISDGGHPHGEWRTSGSAAAELCEFATWIFGPEGFCDLKMLGYGDFSNEDRCSQQQVMLCRRSGGVGSDLPYGLMSSVDIRIWNETAGDLETLTACPVNDPVEYL
jgi:hypothetical protein